MGLLFRIRNISNHLLPYSFQEIKIFPKKAQNLVIKSAQYFCCIQCLMNKVLRKRVKVTIKRVNLTLCKSTMRAVKWLAFFLVS